jgi:hypothetical protein
MYIIIYNVYIVERSRKYNPATVSSQRVELLADKTKLTFETICVACPAFVVG